MNGCRLALLLPNFGMGGAERVVVNLANAFVDRGYDVDVVVLASIGPLLAQLSPEVRVVNLRARRLRGALVPLTRYLRTWQPAALLANMWPLTVIAVWARFLARVRTRVVVAEHTTWSRSELFKSRVTEWKLRLTMRHTFPNADAVVAVSHGAASDLARITRLALRRITVIYNPIVSAADNSSAQEVQEPTVWWSEPHRILAVGMLKAVKDYPTLLNAFRILRGTVDARLLILGEGDCRRALEDQACRLGISGWVFLPGQVADPRPYYRRADLHVLSSVAEGFGNVLVEALAAGTPVVSTDCESGPREILVDGNFGCLVPVGDAAALAEAMAASLRQEHDMAALVARAQHFSIEKATDEYERLLLGQ
jgi:glycosyltransferase involved in cell wall biosynthesis